LLASASWISLYRSAVGVLWVLRQLASVGFLVTARRLVEAVVFFAAVLGVVDFFFFEAVVVVAVVAPNRTTPATRSDRISIQTLCFNTLSRTAPYGSGSSASAAPCVTTKDYWLFGVVPARNELTHLGVAAPA
jgi:hypothetical protein